MKKKNNKQQKLVVHPLHRGTRFEILHCGIGNRDFGGAKMWKMGKSLMADFWTLTSEHI